MDVNALTQQDSPLSVTSSVLGILTFVVAIGAAVYVRMTNLRNSDDDFFKVKTALSWYKTESTWLAELVRAAGAVERPGFTPEQYRRTTEFQMYTFVMDDLQKLEARLLELVVETEERAASSDGPDARKNSSEGWTRVPRRWTTWNWNRTTVAMAWLPVRTKALELVRQRDALTARVLFTQMSMISSRIRDLENRANLREKKSSDGLARVQDMLTDQQAEIHRLEDLVFRIMHRRRLSTGDQPPPPSSSEFESMASTRVSTTVEPREDLYDKSEPAKPEPLTKRPGSR